MYDVTGKDVYRERAEKWWRVMKSRMRLRGDGKYYVWNYWDPAGPWDRKPDGSLKHWVGVHPNGGYYGIDVEGIVTAYEHGLVFTQEDIARLVATNRDFMWNQQVTGAKFQRIDGGKPDKRWAKIAGRAVVGTGAVRCDFAEGLRGQPQPGELGRAEQHAEVAGPLCSSAGPRPIGFGRHRPSDGIHERPNPGYVPNIFQFSRLPVIYSCHRPMRPCPGVTDAGRLPVRRRRKTCMHGRPAGAESLRIMKGEPQWPRDTPRPAHRKANPLWILHGKAARLRVSRVGRY